ncbi:MAG: DUF2892 domain-containing protein [Chitinophagaceae bacterium]|nr:DUF2892 domain-containing protein [Chitinophagaceae bacterium]
MTTNLGDSDRAIRIIATGLIVILYLLGVVAGIFGDILLVLAAVLLLTSLVGFCPLYRLFGINTCKYKKV